jgi:hypothetical protein
VGLQDPSDRGPRHLLGMYLVLGENVAYVLVVEQSIFSHGYAFADAAQVKYCYEEVTTGIDREAIILCSFIAIPPAFGCANSFFFTVAQ